MLRAKNRLGKGSLTLAEVCANGAANATQGHREMRANQPHNLPGDGSGGYSSRDGLATSPLEESSSKSCTLLSAETSAVSVVWAL